MEKRLIMSEIFKSIEFAQVKKAFQVFAHDYEIVQHPNTPVNNPFQKPNGLDVTGHRQYNLTLFPENMTKEEFDKKLKGILVISCMDRDAAKPLYDQIENENPETPIIFLSMAGGIIQEHPKRKKALKTILKYIGKHQDNISQVLATDHDHTCGYIKYALSGTPLATKLGVELAIPGGYSDQKEQKAMKSLIIQSAQDYKLGKLFGKKLKLALAVIDRQGNVSLDTNFKGVPAKKLVSF